MARIPLALAVIALAAQALAAPQLITLGKGGEVGVNFGGYHASAGLGGLLGGGAAGGLHAEAGTPHGQDARAGIGGSVDSGAKGGVYGIEGAGGGAAARGGAYASAHSGAHAASASLSGETVAKEDNTKSFGGSAYAGGGAAAYAGGSVSASGTSGGGTYKDVSINYVTAPPVVVEKHISTNYVAPAPAVHFEKHFSTSYQPVAPVVHVEKHYEVPPPAVVQVEKHVEVPPPVVYKEVYVNKHHYKRPHHHHHHAWAHFDVAGDAGASGSEVSKVKTVVVQPETHVVYKEVRPPIVEKRVDIVSEKEYVPVSADAGYSTKVKFSHRNPTFFSDIFNIPIQAISSVGKLVGNAVAGTNLSVEKTAYVHAG